MSEQDKQSGRIGRPEGYQPEGRCEGYEPEFRWEVPYQQEEPQDAAQQPVNQVNVDLGFEPSYVRNNATMSSSDRTLRLAAFIFMLIGLFSTCWAIIPLAWTIPMTVISWGIYKGTRPNTTAFGVLSLIFVSLVAGILLLISTKDE